MLTESLSALFRYSYTVALKPLLSCATEKGLSARLPMVLFPPSDHTMAEGPEAL
jgi:hypothetical protein